MVAAMTGITRVFEVVGVDMVVKEDMAVVAVADDGDGVDGVDGVDNVDSVDVVDGVYGDRY